MYHFVLLLATAFATQAERKARIAKKAMLTEVDQSEWCTHGCVPEWINDGMCDSACNNEECGFDGEDCGSCAPWCFNSWLGDGLCDID